MKPCLIGSMLKDQPRKNSKSRANRGAEYQFVKNLKPCAKEEKNIFKSRTKEKRGQKNSKSHTDKRAEYQFPKKKVEKEKKTKRLKIQKKS